MHRRLKSVGHWIGAIGLALAVGSVGTCATGGVPTDSAWIGYLLVAFLVGLGLIFVAGLLQLIAWIAGL